MALTVALIAAWAVVCRRGTDRLDLAVIAALLLFAVACVTSAFARQSFDAAWLCTGYAAAFSIARRALAVRSTRQFVIVAMAALSLTFSTVTAARWLSDVVTWLTITGWQFPPLDFHFQTAPWGHRHDVALMITMLLPAWFMLGRSRKVTVGAVIATTLTSVVVFLDGSRNLWIAILAASAAVTGRAIWPRLRALSLRQRWTLAALVLLIVAGGLFAGVAERIINLRTIAARAELWRAGTDAWLSRPLTGQGPGSFPWALQLTDYFDTNSWAPRHPDSAVIQLLAEVGVLGVLSASMLLVSIGRRMWRSKVAAWALLCFGVSCIAANPTDFGFLVAIAIAWSALAIPFKRISGLENAKPAPRRLAYRSSPWVIGLALLPITAGMVLASFAEFSYQAAGEAVATSNLPLAEESLRTAVMLDPRMALYHRTLGVIQWAQSGPRGSLDQLEQAVEANGSDDYAFRILGAAAWLAGDRARGMAAITHAVRLQRSDSNNTLLAAEFIAEQEGSGASLELVAETLQANPRLALAPDWNRYLAGLGLRPREVAKVAAERWQDRLTSPLPVTIQGLWLTALSGSHDLVARAQREASVAPELAAAVTAALNCRDGHAAQTLTRFQAPRETTYWNVRIALAAREGSFDGNAYAILRIMTGSDRGNLDSVDVLSENTAPGFSLDSWGYRRLSIVIDGLAGSLPSPSAGMREWLRGSTEGLPCGAA
jgi:O-antigen ligase